MAEEAIFYDLASQPPNHTWSFNPLKVRMILNYKKVPYKTVWLEYPDVRPTLEALGIPPNTDGNAAFTIPAISLDNNTTHVMDGLAIAEELDRRYPTPALPVHSPQLAAARKQLNALFDQLRPFWMPLVPRNLLNPPGAEYFERTRAEDYGAPLAEYAKGATDERWKGAEPMIKGLADIFREIEGPFALGENPSYADFLTSSAIWFFGRVDQKLYDRVVAVEPLLDQLVKSCAPWRERLDH